MGGEVKCFFTYRNVRYICYIRILQDEKLHFFHPIIELFRAVLSRKTGIEIHAKTQIGAGFRMVHPFNITVGENVIIGNNVNILKGCTIGYALGNKPGTPNIGNNVQIGINATIIGGINIGNDVLVAPNSFVNMDVPDHSVVIGNPARIIHRDNATSQYVYFCVK